MTCAGLLQGGRIGQRILDLAKNPEVVSPGDEDEEKSEVEPDQEYPIDADKVRLEPSHGTLRSSLETVEERTIWAIDGGALSVDLPIGRLIVGRAVVIRNSFYGYETAHRELIIPALPFMICGGPVAKDVPEAASLYLNQALKLIPGELTISARVQVTYSY